MAGPPTIPSTAATTVATTVANTAATTVATTVANTAANIIFFHGGHVAALIIFVILYLSMWEKNVRFFLS